MPLFVCEKCGCVDNTLYGFHVQRHILKVKGKKLQGKSLCTECCPPELEDGTPTGRGEWHNFFPKMDVKTYLQFDPRIEPKDIVNQDVMERFLKKKATKKASK